MDYTVKIPAIQGDIIPLAYVAECMAKAQATAYDAIPFHKQRFDSLLRKYTKYLLAEAHEGRLKVCNEIGGIESARNIIEAIESCGDISEVKRYLVEPDWDRLRRERPPVVEGVAVWDFTGVDLGPVETDWDMTHLLCLNAKLRHLNDWGHARGGDHFSISSEGVEWIEGWDSKQGQLELIICGAAAEKGKAPNKTDVIQNMYQKLDSDITDRKIPKKQSESKLILDTLRDLNFDPLNLPVGSGKTHGAKKLVRDAVGDKFTSCGAFDSRWKNMKQSGEIADKTKPTKG